MRTSGIGIGLVLLFGGSYCLTLVPVRLDPWMSSRYLNFGEGWIAVQRMREHFRILDTQLRYEIVRLVDSDHENLESLS